MEYVIKKFSHKFFFFCMEFVYSAIFTVIFYPLALKHLDISLTNYFLLSMFILIIGGIFLDRGFIYMCISYDNEYNKISNVEWAAIIITELVLYLILGIVIWFYKQDAFLAMYVPLFLFMGGWIWFAVLNGYLNAKESVEENGLKINTKILRNND
ncbi:hypothetical protein Q75_02850 [Bacillus coahuilensis p1.1.43]|uniref:DUF3021 domain-containing protein n=1 Tax=Bacillus coahuilensis p1.1.43 TaxID=1150625 RepID=A0A147KBF3_9BACI|nr:hypothetical protein [Bacillus coahuilensis]KUP08452.1 hypothetical protein Q75_02850 [Bacillus coahuilensis p1.1.43]